MSNVSEDISRMSVDLLFKAMQALGNLMISGGKMTYDLLGDLVRYANSQEYDSKTRKALSSLYAACEDGKETPRQISVEAEDAVEIERWLKKQNMLYAACTPKDKKVSDKEKLEKAAAGEKADEKKITTILFLESDKDKVNNALAIRRFEKGHINVLPPEAFFLLHDKKSDISIVDGLNYEELVVFRELAKEHNLGCTEMKNGSEQADESLVGSYKVVCAKKDADKMKAIMRMVSWNLTGEHGDKIKEKVLERDSVFIELKKLLDHGVQSGTKTFTDESGNALEVENAKYIVNAKDATRFIKMTSKGFYRRKAVGEDDFVAKNDPNYNDLLEEYLSEYSDFVIMDASEWELQGLGKKNLRDDAVRRKVSVFPEELSMQKEEVNLRREQKKRMEKLETMDESAWLFHKFDPDSEAPLSEVLEENYNAPSKPYEEVVSVHYNMASKRSEKYRYYDVESDEKSVDSVIMAAKERTLRMEQEKARQKEKDF